MLDYLHYVAVSATPEPTSDTNMWLTFFGGSSLGGIVVGGVMTIFKSIADKKIAPVKDIQDRMEALISGLHSTVELLQNERERDQLRLTSLQERITSLEKEASDDYKTLSRLQEDITVLKSDIARKSSYISILVDELAKLGVIVEGLSLSPFHELTIVRKGEDKNEVS